jgi:hypothetical protein
MQLKGLAPSVLRASCWGLFLLIALVGTARADESSGSWSGSVEGRGNYYWERSTRVVVPEGKVELTAPNGIRMYGEYLVDVISSASIGAGADSDGVFTELRHGIGAGVGKEFDLDSSQLDLTLHGTYSTENDYKSWIYGLQSMVSFDERNTELLLGVTRVSDDITSNSAPSFAEELDGITVSLGVQQVLSPTITFALSYQLAYLEGFLGNAYRSVRFSSGAPPRENPPNTRVRHNAIGHIALSIPSTGTAIHLLHRAYIDSWDVAAITPELRIYQLLGQSSVLRLHYRFYAQTSASFARENGIYPGSPLEYTGPTTGDPKLLSMRTHTLGLAFEQRLSFLSDSFLSFAQDAWIDIGIDRWWSTSSFGNGIIGTAGGRIPF